MPEIPAASQQILSPHMQVIRLHESESLLAERLAEAKRRVVKYVPMLLALNCIAYGVLIILLHAIYNSLQTLILNVPALLGAISVILILTIVIDEIVRMMLQYVLAVISVWLSKR